MGGLIQAIVMLVKACALLVLVAIASTEPLAESDEINVAYAKTLANAKLEAKRNLLLGREQPQMSPAEVLLEEVPTGAETSFAKVPSWVSTEDDLEEFLQAEKKKGTSIVRTGEKQQGSMPTETEMALVQDQCRYTCNRIRHAKNRSHCNVNFHACRHSRMCIHRFHRCRRGHPFHRRRRHGNAIRNTRHGNAIRNARPRNVNRHFHHHHHVTGRRHRRAAEEMSLLQYTKFPTWVETEDDMEAYFKQQHTKVVRKDSGNGGVNPSGRKFVVDVQTKKSVEAEEAPISLLEEPTEGSTPAVKDRMQRIAKLNKRMANAGANKLIEELNNYQVD